MAFSFEVRESDLLGRIGRLRVGSKVIETPYMFPVIHPVNQAVSTRELSSMGFGGLMTNSYIIHSRRREEALEKGIHSLLDFQGVFMTDSGGYQVLEYGELEVDYARIAAFQADIGSELAVTLDRPTGFSESKRYAMGTMEYSLKNALATMDEFGGRRTIWLGPVQGGLFPALLRKSASSMVNAGFRFLALGSPVQVMENYRFGDLVRMVAATRKAMPYSVPLHLFGAGHPLTMALAVALGCDTFDSASYILFAREGRFMTERGVSRLEALKYLPCSCPVCTKTSVKGLMDLDHRDRTRSLAVHNLHILRKELDSCKEAISEGRLWDLIREKANAHPKLWGALAEFERAGDLLRDGTPPLKDKGLFVRDAFDGARPELKIAKDRLAGAQRKNSGIGLLVTNAGSLPLAKVLQSSDLPRGVDVYRIHEVLGAYPAELEFVYPFTQTVTSPGAVNHDLLGPAKKQLRGMGYTRVLVATVGKDGRMRVTGLRSRRRSKGPSPSAPSSSTRLRSPRRP